MIDIVLPDGALAPAEVLHLSPRGLYAAVKLTGTPHKGTVDAFHVGTGKRATPPNHFDSVRTQKVARELADDLDEFDPVEVDGTLRLPAAEYHAHVDAFVAGLS